MMKKTAMAAGSLLLAACGQRVYYPHPTFFPPEPPAPRKGSWVGGEVVKVPAQYAGEEGTMAGLSAGLTHFSRWFRADLAAFLFGGTYHYEDPSFTGEALSVNPALLARLSLLLPITRLRLEGGVSGGVTFQAGVPRGVDMFPFFFLGGVHVGLGLPDRFWVRLGYGYANSGVAVSVALPGNWTVGGGYIHWWEDPKDTGVRLGVSRTWR